MKVSTIMKNVSKALKETQRKGGITMDNMLAYATSTDERLEVLSSYYSGEEIEDNLSQWLSRKSLCTEELFDLSLKNRGICRKDFNLAIKSLSKNDRKLLLEKSKDSEWYKTAQEIFSNKKEIETPIEIIDFSYAYRPFLYYLKNQINQIKLRGFAIAGQDAFCINLAEELLQIAAKTLVHDLHEEKSKNIFEGDTSNERFVYYMKKRFGNTEALIKFYEDYPVLLRILTERVMFHINNYKKFVLSIEQSLSDFTSTFSLSSPYCISKIKVGVGDSHSKGKTVILFNMNNKRFVFKYKNLEIGERFNKFLSYIEECTDKKFYKIKRIIKEDFCIEEFVHKSECKSSEDVQKFYHRFGEYVALAYLLCGNDFHYENLIAHSDFPVLIDIETLIQNDSPVLYADNPYIELALKKYNSVLGSALLPFKAYENRIEPLADGEKKGQGIRISAFDGKKQKSPYKGLGLINVNTDEVRFDYVEYELSDSNNIPMFNGEEVNAERYKLDVVRGFNEICEFFRTNSYDIVKLIEELFSDVIVRNVIKSTQKYVDMLGYGYHPKCMKDYLEREKLFENLWGYEYKNKSAVLPEIRDLLVNDVPIFFNNTSSRDLITSDGAILKNYYSRTAIEHVKERILGFTEQEYLYQKLRLELSLGIYQLKTENIKIGKSAQNALDNIIEMIISRAKYDQNRKSVAFEDFIYDADGELDYNALNAELYDGLSGIYLLILFYAQKYTNPRIGLMKEAIENTILKLPRKSEGYSSPNVYVGKYSILYPLYHKYKLEGEEKDILLAESLLENLEHEIDRNVDGDWLGGVGGLIQVLLNFYKLTKRKVFLEKAELLSNVWEKKEVRLCGFAHGFSGIIYASYSLFRETGKQRYLNYTTEYLKRENSYFDGKVWPDLREGKKATSHWCHGTVGIGLTRLYLLEHGYNDAQVRKDLMHCINDAIITTSKESGLCHGEMGRFIFLKEVQRSKLVAEEYQKQIDRALAEILEKIFSEGAVIGAFRKDGILGLMTGITGVGYGLLKELDISIPNILCLE